MASIQKRGNKYRVQIVKRGVRKNATFRTKAEAQQWAYEEEHRIDTLADGGIMDILFSDVIVRYQQEVSITKRTAQQEIKRLDRLLNDPIANRYISDITRDDINDWIEHKLSAGLLGSSVRRELTILSNIFKFSVERWNYLVKSPMIGVVLPKNEKPRSQRFTPEEIEQLVKASGYFNGLKKSRARVGAAILFAIETAMRAGEICGLTWENIHFEKRIAHLPMTKNGTARDVPLSREAVRILKELEAVRIDDRVFQLKPEVLSRLFYETKTPLGFSHLNFHDTRREALTRLARKVDVMTLSKISGHKDIKILNEVYYAPNMSEVADLLG